MGFLSKLLTMGEGKQLKRYQAKVDKINALEPEFQALSDEELAAKTQEFRERYAAGESLDDLLPEAFAAVREASVRTIGLRHFDVQLIGGMALNEGQIAEMKTGEGKTLVSTLAGYLNAIPGHNVHIVTVNDYLARRDCEWMGQIYRFLGMKTGLIQNGMPPTAEESVVASDPEAEFVAVTAINREALRQVEEKLGDRIRYTTPLLREVQAGTPTVWAYRTAGLLYIKVYDGSLRFAGVIPAPDTADVCYFTERLEKEFALKSCELRISGDDAKACGKLLKGYFKRIVCE